MDKGTKTYLSKVTQQFYQIEADSFNATRQTPWLGFKTIAQKIIALPPPLKVLDLGSGNGRLFNLLENLKLNFTYLGIEAEAKLSQHNRGEVRQEDLIVANWAEKLKGQKFDFIAILNVMHHIPSFEERAKLLIRAGHLLTNNGILIVSLWDFIKSQQHKLEAIEEQSNIKVETHDYFMSWQKSINKRYVHYVDAREKEKLLTATNKVLTLTDSFWADGKSKYENEYWCFKKSV